MADRFWDAGAVAGTSGAAEEGLGEEAGGKVGGVQVAELAGVTNAEAKETCFSYENVNNLGGANVVDGGDVICERNVFGDSSTDQLVDDNGQDYRVTGSVAEGTALLRVVPSLENIEVDEASAPNDDGSGDDDAMKVDKQFDVKQGNSESFQNAVGCALEEVSRREELGLACSCLSVDVLDEIKVQTQRIYPVSKRISSKSSSGADRLGLVIAKAQLLVIYRHKGFNRLPEFQSFGDLEEDDTEALDLKDSIQAEDAKDGMAVSGQGSIDVPKGSAHRRKHNLKDIVYNRRKERSVFELMDEAMLYSEDDEFELDGTLVAKRCRRLKQSDESGSADERKSISSGKVASPLPKPSFKIGECIIRVASQMTRSPSLKAQSEEAEHVEHAAVSDAAEKVNTGISVEDQSLENSLSQLQSAAVSPLGDIVS
ncbi:hypothetical protein MLD38_024195 [Melastoma candidum]|uniref:Uncharacterized protein n=1 Tax=Melastoma candidum TaxID=119954 RepID=A0ACB9NUY5_9MYRT|nr:hypothetical protein MLD38_024195 [Melastoma candidum]